MTDPEAVTASQAAREKRCSPSTIYNAILKRKFGRFWWNDVYERFDFTIVRDARYEGWQPDRKAQASGRKASETRRRNKETMAVAGV
tara:strand:+ start:2905 stop:3165 length:261 start_codon:yes stop_codon:yes gene_type:complete